MLPERSVLELQADIDQIKERNQRVEADKAWETSWTRRLLILVLTYLVIVIFFMMAKLPDPFVNAIVPAVAFLLSTMTVPLFKKWWLRRVNKK